MCGPHTINGMRQTQRNGSKRKLRQSFRNGESNLLHTCLLSSLQKFLDLALLDYIVHALPECTAS